MNDDELREILGHDPDPELSAEERQAIVARVRAEEDAALDRVLELARVDLPDGLAARVRGAVAAERARAARRGRRTLVRLVGGGLLAAAAAWAVLVLGPGRGEAPGDVGPTTAAEGAPLDDLLAALPELEQLDVLMELEPLEADVLLMFDPEDELLLELLDENG